MIEVTAAIIAREERVLVARRNSGHLKGKWEFPGGKIEPGETPEQCLERELFEEFTVKTEIAEFFAENTHKYEDKTVRLIAYRVRHISGEFIVSAHDSIKWVTLSQLHEIDFAPADIPIAKMLIAEKPV